ncbi:hypothetical protein FRX31_007725 [Thalictrum thalictroides]|uniref:Uncharacterized protein n=1 Tax=Thalictrum thalictroides TaxID=46969 RepID=A0A7J6X1N1_THATH|nr:hypothetical protein FRX31_007725 [Thalictrum thalictroides]
MKEAGRAIRTFLWFGDPSMRKGTTVAFEKMCKPLIEGGLGIGRLAEVNKALLMKLALKVIDGKDDFPLFMCHKYIDRYGDFIEYHKPNSLWLGLEHCLILWTTPNGLLALVRE